MADDFVQLQQNSTGNKVDCSVVTVGANAVDRQRINISDPSDANGHAAVITGTPTTEYGLVVRPVGTITAAISGTATVTFGTSVVTFGTSTVTFGQAVIASGTITANLGNSIPTGTNSIGTVSAAITNTPTVTFGQAVIASGTITANIGNTPTVTFGTATVTFGQAVIASGTITANIGNAIPTGANLLGTVTANIGNSPTVTFGTATVQGTVTANVVGTITIGSTVTATISGTPTVTFGVATVTFGAALSQGYTGNLTAAAGNPLQMGILDSSGRIQYVQGDDSKRILIAGGGTGATPTGGVLSVQPVDGALTGFAVNGTTTAGNLSLNGKNTVAVQIVGTWAATVQFEATVDGTTYFSIFGRPVGGGTSVSSATANGQWQFNVSGYTGFRVRVSAFTSGNAILYINGSIGGSVVDESGLNSLGSITATLSGTSTVTFGTSTVTFGSAVIASGTITANLGNALQAGSAQIGSVTAIISGTPTVTIGSIVVASGTIAANLNAGSNQIGSVTATISGTPTVTFGTATVTFGTATVTFGTSTVAGTVTANSSDIPNPAGGWTPFLSASVTGTAQTITGIAANFGGYNIYNPNTSVAFVQMFDAATVTVGTTTPKHSYGIPPLAAEVLDSSKGINFSNSMKVAATTTVTGVTGVTTGVVFNAWYKTA